MRKTGQREKEEINTRTDQNNKTKNYVHGKSLLSLVLNMDRVQNELINPSKPAVDLQWGSG